MAGAPTAPAHGPAAQPAVRIEPAPAQWDALLEKSRRRPGAEKRIAFRRALGLAEDRPIIMTGHQLEFFHPGVLAKYIAAQQASATLGAVNVWIAVDQDDNDFASFAAPQSAPSGELRRVATQLAPDSVGAGVPVGTRPAVNPTAPENFDAPLESITRGAARMIEALRRRAEAPDAADQMIGALDDLMSPVVAPAPTIRAASLVRTTLFAELLDRMRSDPAPMRAAYNRAAEAHSEAGVRPLRDEDELPLWIVAPGRPRMRARVGGIEKTPVAHLAPRALLMTGLLRLAGADLFIHGIGGDAYDHVTDQWFAEWLGVELAPSVLVTADLALPLPGAEISTGDAERQIWLAHHARHDPGVLGDEEARAEKERRLALVKQARAEGADPSPHFQEMQRRLRAYRERHRDDLAALDEKAARARAALASRAVTTDRTWPFPLHEDAALARLRDAIASRFRTDG